MASPLESMSKKLNSDSIKEPNSFQNWETNFNNFNGISGGNPNSGLSSGQIIEKPNAANAQGPNGVQGYDEQLRFQNKLKQELQGKPI